MPVCLYCVCCLDCMKRRIISANLTLCAQQYFPHKQKLSVRKLNCQPFVHLVLKKRCQSIFTYNQQQMEGGKGYLNCTVMRYNNCVSFGVKEKLNKSTSVTCLDKTK